MIQNTCLPPAIYNHPIQGRPMATGGDRGQAVPSKGRPGGSWPSLRKVPPRAVSLWRSTVLPSPSPRLPLLVESSSPTTSASGFTFRMPGLGWLAGLHRTRWVPSGSSDLTCILRAAFASHLLHS